MTALDGALVLWFVLTAASVALVVVDLAWHTPAATVMKWGWALVVAYTGPVGLVIYLLSCREPLPGWLSRNALMGGMIPVTSILARHVPRAMRPGGLRFWGVALAVRSGPLVRRSARRGTRGGAALRAPGAARCRQAVVNTNSIP